MCTCACMLTRMYVLEGEPALLAFTSTAIEHLCLALLLVATVTKAQSGVAAAAKQRARDTGKDRERGREISPVDLITTTDSLQRIRKHSSDTVTSEMSTPQRDGFRFLLAPFSVTHMHTH